MLRSWKTQAIRSETQSSFHRLNTAALIWTRVTLGVGICVYVYPRSGSFCAVDEIATNNKQNRDAEKICVFTGCLRRELVSGSERHRRAVTPRTLVRYRIDQVTTRLRIWAPECSHIPVLGKVWRCRFRRDMD